MLGNPSHLNITGGFDGKRILAFQKLYALEHPAKFKSYISSTVAKNGYISRYQVWTSKQCKGKMFRYSCVYGVEDLPVIIKQDHLRVRKRESSPIDFDSSPYAEIPLVELSRGIPFQNLTHPEWLLRLHELIET
ncbi:hypothetical protein GCK32_005884 [Trichostrongylus colubriformis]|uniref:Uncharacterized protein n=1 Tax=Trichostrongylus colubriformis TaxID=6319 RepID=A0AAN8FGR1_TRICO